MPATSAVGGVVDVVVVAVVGAASIFAWLEWLGSSNCFLQSWGLGSPRGDVKKGNGVAVVVVGASPSGFVGAAGVASSGCPFGVMEALEAWQEHPVECSTCLVDSLFFGLFLVKSTVCGNTSHF